MVLTQAQVDESLKIGWRYILNSVKWDYEVQPGETKLPLSRNDYASTGDIGSPPLICAIPGTNADWEAGSLTSDSYGSYKPFKGKGPFVWRHPNRKSQCELEVGTITEGTASGPPSYNWYKNPITYKFKWRGDIVATYKATYESRWNYSDSSDPEVRLSVEKISTAPGFDGVVFLAPDRIVDSISNPVWVSRATNGLPAVAPPVSVYNSRTQRLIYRIIQDLALYMGGMDPLARELTGKTAQDAYLAMKKFDDDWNQRPDFWEAWWGILGDDVHQWSPWKIGVPGEKEHWVHSWNTVQDDLVMADLQEAGRMFTPSFGTYFSRVSDAKSKAFYLSQMWPNSTYLQALEAVDLLRRDGGADLSVIDDLLAWAKWDDNSEEGVRKGLPIGSLAPRIGTAESHIGGLLEDILGVEYQHGHYDQIVPVPDWHGVYSGYWLTAWFWALTIAYSYAKHLGDATYEAKWGTWMDEAAVRVRSIQVQADTILRYEREDHTVGQIGVPHMIGGFLWIYDVDGTGVYATEGVSVIQRAFQDLLGKVSPWDEQNPNTVPTGAFEPTMYGMCGFMNYRKLRF